MSKAAKDVVHDTLNIEMVDNYNCLSCGHHQPESLVSKALRVVAALTKAGWLREEPRVGPCGEGAIKRLTRERDEALNLRDQYEARMVAAERGYYALRATAASPEVMRVVEAAEAIGKHPACEVRNFPPLLINNLRDAVDALSASRQPKAQEPRYRVVSNYDGHQVERIADKKWVAAYYHMTDTEARAEAECARLNGEVGGK